jgi:hypothetical protein
LVARSEAETVVAGVLILMEHVLGPICGPGREQPVVHVFERAAAADGDEA